SFVLAIIAVYILGVRTGGGRLWSGGVALAFGSTPAFLFYSFEARVYVFASLLIVLFIGLLFLLLEGARGSIVGVGVFLGWITAWAHLWNVCLLLAVGLCLPWIVWRDLEHWRKGARVALVIGFGLGWVTLQTLYVFSLRVPGDVGLPLLTLQPWKT